MPDEHRLRLGDIVEIDGETWVWERVRRGTEANLRRDGTADDWLVVSVPELLAHAGSATRDMDLPLRPTEGDWPADVRDMETRARSFEPRANLQPQADDPPGHRAGAAGATRRPPPRRHARPDCPLTAPPMVRALPVCRVPSRSIGSGHERQWRRRSVD